MSDFVTEVPDVRIPGTSVTAQLGKYRDHPNTWFYILWDDGDNGDGWPHQISVGDIDFTGLDVRPDQVARVAYLLDLEYSEAPW